MQMTASSIPHETGMMWTAGGVCECSASQEYCTLLNGTQVESSGVNTAKPAVVMNGAISPFWLVLR